MRGDRNKDLELEILKQQLRHLEAELKTVRKRIENHESEHFSVSAIAQERGWQIKIIIVSALAGAAATTIFSFLGNLSETRLPTHDPIEWEEN